MHKPCEYCGTELPLAINKKSRQIRSRHYASCEKRLALTYDHRVDRSCGGCKYFAGGLCEIKLPPWAYDFGDRPREVAIDDSCDLFVIG